MRIDQALEARLAEAAERFCVGQITAVVNNQVTVSTTAGATPTINRLATWTPAIGDIVLIAKTGVGWVALGKIA